MGLGDELELSLDAHDGDGEVVQTGEVARQMAGAHPAALDRHAGEHPWPVAALRLLTLTGAQLSEILNLEWDELGELSQDGASARLEDSKTGPRTVWLGPEAARLLAALPRPEGAVRVFPERTSRRLGSTASGAPSARKRGCPACASTTRATPGPPTAS